MRSSRSLKRRVPTRTAKRKFIIFTEGKNTEPDYFKAIKSELFGALVDIEIVAAVGAPMTIAKQAATARRRARRSSFEDDDEVWAVFDRDEHPSVTEAIQRCEASKVGVAFSNPCFELWLILHHRDFDGPDDRHQVQALLAKIVCDYEVGARKTTDCTKLMPYVDDAEDRAERQLARRLEEGYPPARPFTTVFKLTRKMRAAHEAFGASAAVC